MRPACSAALLAIRTGCTRQRVPALRSPAVPSWTSVPPVAVRAFSLTATRSGSAKPAQRNNDDKLLELVQKRSEEHERLSKQAPPADDAEASMQHAKQMRELEPVAMAWKEYEEVTAALAESRLLLDDSDATMRAMAEEEIGVLETQANEILGTRLPSLLLQPSTTDPLSAILELKAGVGGDEASLFVDQVSRMYTRYANDQQWKCEILSKTAGNAAGLGGLKEITIKVVGEGAFGDLRFERGVHRVQRVPETESAGRVHTSTIAVVVLPVLENSGGSDDVVDEKDVKTEVMRSRGAGGQHVNKTESAVRLTHIPTGISVSMQDSRSQHQNKAWAWQILRARLLDRHLAEQQAQKRAARRDQVKGMDRSDKVRTYNFPQDRVTDHRIGLTLSGLEGILEGEGLGYIIQELKAHQQSLRMENLLELGENVQD